MVSVHSWIDWGTMLLPEKLLLHTAAVVGETAQVVVIELQIVLRISVALNCT